LDDSINREWIFGAAYPMALNIHAAKRYACT
jgi:hypothetical protein